LRRRSRRNREEGIVIVLVAVFMLFVIGAMAALSIDVVTLYTARSEAQLAADAAALAGARVLANSGATSDPNAASDGLMSAAQTLATNVAIQVAQQNQVGGANLTPSQVLPPVYGGPITNPTVAITVQVNNLPTFFARIWGRTTIAVSASAKAEAYNSSPNPLGAPTNPPLPVAPMCVKPWLLPNKSPATAGDSIFTATTGTIGDPALLGWESTFAAATRLSSDCTTACGPAPSAPAWKYYPGDPADFPPPSASSVACTGCAGFNNYQLSIAGCVQAPIACNGIVHVYTTNTDPNLDGEAAAAVDALTNSTANEGDMVDTAVASPPAGTEPFQFLAGGDNPVVQSGALTARSNIMLSDSLVTVPVIDTTTVWPPAAYPKVQIIGFVQLFLNPNGRAVRNNLIRTRVINLVGCGTPAAGGVPAAPPAILGNGASPVAVRLISP